MNVSFDFDGTLHRDGRPLWPAMGLLRWHQQTGHRVMIVTTRTESHEHAAWWRVHDPHRPLAGERRCFHVAPAQSCGADSQRDRTPLRRRSRRGSCNDEH